MRSTVAVLAALLWAGFDADVCVSEDATPTASEESQPRTPWRTSRFNGTPEPPSPFVASRVFPSLKFNNPVDWAVEPGTGYVYVLELEGKLLRFNPRAENPTPVLIEDMRTRVAEHNDSYGITFHPNFTENRQLFWCYVLPPNRADGSRVCRFTLTDTEPPRIEPRSEEVVITWPSGGHNGGCLKFGPDGYLYVTTGDGTGPFPPDGAAAGQNLADLRSTIMRLDVDRPDGARDYSIPADNPFIDLENARPEIWAYGFRNPWKISFSPLTGDLYCGDVGWELWELLYRVERGGNYGWSVMEGRQPVRSDVQRGPTPILPPLADHKHTEARSITGGYVYTGSRLPELHGAYIYGDWSTGKIWALRNDGNTLVSLEEIADASLAIITFGLDADGELYIVDYAGGVYRLEVNPLRDRPSTFPRRLSESGLFSSTRDHVPAPGVLPFELKAEAFMDGARAERFIGLPGNSSIAFTRNHDQWRFPEGTVVAKTLSAPIAAGGATQPTWKRIETQVMHFDGTEWRAYTYAWDDDQTDAVLVPDEGMQRMLSIVESPSHITDEYGRRTVAWRFHSRAECLTCHMPQPNVLLSFEPVNLDVPHLPANGNGSAEANQLDEFVRLGLFDKRLPENVRQHEMVDPYDDSAPLQARARSYLAVNCSCCHRRQGGGTAHIEFPIQNALEKTNAVDAPPTQGTFNIPHAKIVAPSDPFTSVLYYRMATVGRGHMPHLGTRNVDEPGLKLIGRWIRSLAAGDPPPDSAQRENQLVAALAHVREGADVPGIIRQLLGSTTGALRLAEAVAANEIAQQAQLQAVTLGVSEGEPHIRGLFERFLPENQRRATLGTAVDPASILALDGDAAQGRELFLNGEGISCRNCHQLEGRGKPVGPDLAKVLRSQTREQILESILEPSRKIDRQYVTHTVATLDGKVVSGLVISASAEAMTLRDAAGKDVTVDRREVDEDVPQPKSLMPDLLVRDLTAQDVADLLAYLTSLPDAD